MKPVKDYETGFEYSEHRITEGPRRLAVARLAAEIEGRADRMVTERTMMFVQFLMYRLKVL